MATMLLGGWVLAVITSSHSIAEEIESGTAMLLLAKPVQRGTFIIGKVLGIALGLGVFCFLSSIATLIAVRVAKDQFWYDTRGMWGYFLAIILCMAGGGLWNFIKRSSFPMNALLCLLAGLPVAALIIRLLPIDGEMVAYAWRITPALLLVSYAVTAMGVLAAALSTRLQLITNMLVCSVVFTVGLMSDYLLGRFAQDNWVAGILYAAIPNWQLMWMADALASEDTGIPLSYVLWGAAYLAMFVGIFITLAFILFRHREIGSRA
jgi:ABC-type Na+ efflux pump permease subunit